MDTQLFRQILDEHGYTYRSLAQKLGISPTTLSNIINDRNYPSYYFMVSICNYFNLSQETFMMIFFATTINFEK